MSIDERESVVCVGHGMHCLRQDDFPFLMPYVTAHDLSPPICNEYYKGHNIEGPIA